MPVRHFDHLKSIKDKKNYDFNTYAKKRVKQKKIPTDKRKLPNRDNGGIFQEVSRLAAVTPGPWTYDLNLKWIKGPNAKEPVEKVKNDDQKMKFKWKQTPQEQREMTRPKRTKQKKITEAYVTQIPFFLLFVYLLLQKAQFKKMTYIDHINQKHTKKKYPLPGPGAHFHDKQTMRRVKSEQQDIMKRHFKDPFKDKANFTKDERKMDFLANPKDAKAFPAPNRYNPGVRYLISPKIGL